MLPGRSRIDTAQRRAGCVGQTELPVQILFEELHELLAPKGTARDEMLRQDPFRAVLPCSPHDPAENRRDVNELPNAIAFDGPALRVGVKLKLVVLPAEGAAPLAHCYPDEGDKVLKLFDGRGTLPCSVW